MRNTKIKMIIFGIAVSLSLCGCGKVSDLIRDKKSDQEAGIEEESTESDTDAEEKEDASSESASVTENEEESPSEESGNNRDELTQTFKETIAQESGRPESDIRFFDIDDFDGNGDYEAFALVGDEPDYEMSESGLVNGDVWFVNRSGAKAITDSVGMGYECSDLLLDFDSVRYVVFQDAYATGELSHVFEVKGNDVSEAVFSRLGTVQEQEGDSFRILDSSYDSEYDPDIGDMLGHTWKSYYFYYDEKTGSVKEYGGSEISNDEARDLTGRDFADECLKDGDKLESIYYRKNGLVNINYSRPETGGSISYYHRTWDTEKECYIDDYAAESDEEQLGTYRAELCPEIAEYPIE